MRTYFYLIVVILFNILFVVTLLVDFQGLFYTISEETPDIIKYNRIPIQGAIFVYGLTGIVSFLYLIEILFNQSEKIKNRLLKGFSLIVIIYLINWIISLLVISGL